MGEQLETSTLERVRELCYGEKTVAAFNEIITLLDGENDEDIQGVAVDYCEEHLESWPDEARFFQLSTATLSMSQLSSCWFKLVRAVEIFPIRGVDWEAFFGNESWSFIKRVYFHNNFRDENGYVSFFRSRSFKNLERLVVGYRRRSFGSDIIRAIIACSFLSKLKSLHLRLVNNLNGDVTAFFVGGRLNDLESLCLEGNCFGVDGVEDFLEESADRTKLKCLDLSSFSVDAREIGVLCADESLMTGLEVLRLSRNAIGSQGLAHIANCPFSGSLRELSLSRCGIGSGGIEKLVESGHLLSLCKLYLNNNILGDEGAVLIANSEWMKRLKLLFLKGNRITDVGGRALMNSPYLSDKVKYQLIGQGVISVKVFEEWSSSVEVEDLQSGVASEVDGSLEG